MTPAYWITAERFEASRARHPAIAARVDASIGWDGEVLESALATAEALVGWRFPVDRLADRAPELRWIHVIGAGVDHLLPLDWLPPRVVLTNNSGVHAPKAAEYACMAILMLNNRIPFHVTNGRAARWEKVLTSLVCGKTLAVVGVGRIGGAAARHAKRFGMRVLGVRRSGGRQRHVDEMFTPEELDRVLPQADFVLLTAPLTPETRGLIGRRELGLLKAGAGLINMSRGSLLDTDALIRQLEAGKLSGAVLDVFEQEPLPGESPLWRAPNVILTPHVSSDDPEQYASRSLDLILDNVRRYLAGRPLRNVVDAVRGY